MLPADSTNSSENMYTMMNPIGPAGTRPNVSDDMGGVPGGPPPHLPALTPPLFAVPNGAGAGGAHERDERNGAPSHERILRWVPPPPPEIHTHPPPPNKVPPPPPPLGPAVLQHSSLILQSVSSICGLPGTVQRCGGGTAGGRGGQRGWGGR